MNRKYERNNIFGKILRGEIPCDKVYEDDKVLAFNDINPQADIHILLIPKKPVLNFDDFIKNSTDNDISDFFKTAQKIAESLNVSGYKIVSNCGEKADQVIFHYHLHILGYK